MKIQLLLMASDSPRLIKDGQSYLHEKLTTGDLNLNLTNQYSATQSVVYKGDNSNYSLVIPIFSEENDVDMNQSWNSFYGFPPNIVESGDIGSLTPFQNLNNALLSNKKYKALLKNCFTPRNMVHFVAISGLRTSGVLEKLNFDQTKKTFCNKY